MGEVGGHAPLAKERWFFFYLAVAIFATVAAGFGSQVVTGRTWFTDFPWQVHAHVALFSSWIILYLTQNWLVANGRSPQLHRRLGWLGAVIAMLMIPLGIAGTMGAIARGAINGIFPLGLFLALDVLHLVGFGVLTFAGLRMRRHAAWHKRLMFCGTVLLTAPAISRLAGFLPAGSPTPLLVVAALFLFLLTGIFFDRFVLGRVHPAYYWGVAATATVELLVVPIGGSAPVITFAKWLAT
ncbi:hypothetical protein [Sphingobium phenoxybenzoativorans]|uniref:hypothetical protein n=1 Tax=Sphingobium phenoxybenzoativorans TaxID=1592790 RepID=UPI0008721BE5|nr:hypothetical protein [Sphingobium phenoxybenzoativorans]